MTILISLVEQHSMYTHSTKYEYKSKLFDYEYI